MSVWVEVSGYKKRRWISEFRSHECHKECKHFYPDDRNIERGKQNKIAAFFLFDLLHADPPLAMLECDKLRVLSL
jgi:hypothetical protein